MRAFVISGGGARIAQAQLLIERFLKSGGSLPDMIVGTSAGGLLAMLVSHLGIEGARNKLRRIGSRRDVFADQMNISKGLWSHRPLQRLIQEVITHRPMIPYHVCAYNLAEQRKVYFKHSDGWHHLASTACIPGLVSPVDSIYTDGGVVESTPLSFAIKNGATTIDVFMCSAKEQRTIDPPNNIFEVIAKSLEAMRIENAEQDIKYCNLRNKLGDNKIDVKIHYPERDVIGVLEFEKIKEIL